MDVYLIRRLIRILMNTVLCIVRAAPVMMIRGFNRDMSIVPDAQNQVAIAGKQHAAHQHPRGQPSYEFTNHSVEA